MRAGTRLRCVELRLLLVGADVDTEILLSHVGRQNRRHFHVIQAPKNLLGVDNR